MNLIPEDIPKWIKENINYNNFKYVFSGVDDDDCAIINVCKDKKIVITTDFLNSNPIAVELGVSTNYDLGKLLVASNLSDLCGTGAKPKAFLLCIKMRRSDTMVETIELIKGVKSELERYKIPLVGGDTKLGAERAFLGIAIGESSADRKLFLKNAAIPGDIIWLSGNIGTVSSALYGLSKKIMAQNWNMTAKRFLVRTDVPLKKSKLVALSKIGNGGTDLSDGLGADLNDLLRSSNVGCILFADQIPSNSFVKQLAFHIKVEPWMLGYILGGDFQFIVTANPNEREKMKNYGFIEIGKVTGIDNKILIHKNKEHFLPELGHSDGRNLSFSEEIDFLLNNLIMEIESK